MADSRFHRNVGPFTLADLARLGQAQLLPEAHMDRQFLDVSTLQDAGPEQVSFFDNRKYQSLFLESNAGACVVSPEFVGRGPKGMELLISNNPYKTYARIAQAFYPRELVETSYCHPSAIVDPTAKIGSPCHISAGVVIGAGVEIGAGTLIEENVVIKNNVTVGTDCQIMSNVTLSHCMVGNRVVIYPGVRVGQPGFGFAPDALVPVKVPQLGRVIIEDDVEVGANSAIDRGALGDTVIGTGTMIDNLVQIGHNVRTGRGCVIVSQVGISGSTVLSDYVQLGGQAGIAGHVRIGKGAKVAAKAGVMRDISPGEAVGGIPAVPIKQWHRQTASLTLLTKHKKTAD
jgi:UDP-3-O-[3-hydroxymyristoyl] glucosamine N-acyltransferase